MKHCDGSGEESDERWGPVVVDREPKCRRLAPKVGVLLAKSLESDISGASPVDESWDLLVIFSP